MVNYAFKIQVAGWATGTPSPQNKERKTHLNIYGKSELFKILDVYPSGVLFPPQLLGFVTYIFHPRQVLDLKAKHNQNKYKAHNVKTLIMSISFR